MRPLISIIIPTYRRIQSLKEALLSVCRQDYSHWEIILVDDNADPIWNKDVASIATEIRSSFLPFGTSLKLIVNTKNSGSAQSRNTGIRASRGSYITFLDDDDIYFPSKLSSQLNRMLKSDADYSLADLILVNDNGATVEHKTHPYLTDASQKEELLRLHLLYHLTGTAAMMFRASYLFQIGGFGSIDIGDEFYLMAEAIENKGTFEYIPQPLVRARVHFDGTGLSCGPMKLLGEHTLYSFKKKYFHLLSKKDIRYIRMRHYAVLAFSHIKTRSYLMFIREALLCVLISPADCIFMLYNRYSKNRIAAPDHSLPY